MTKPTQNDGAGDEEQEPADYSVGYGRPPKETRFQPGRSGNPGGRKKGAGHSRKPKEQKGVIEKALSYPVRALVWGRPVKMSTDDALLLKLIETAQKESNPAAREVLALADSLGLLQAPAVAKLLTGVFCVPREYDFYKWQELAASGAFTYPAWAAAASAATLPGSAVSRPTPSNRNIGMRQHRPIRSSFGGSAMEQRTCSTNFLFPIGELHTRHLIATCPLRLRTAGGHQPLTAEPSTNGEASSGLPIATVPLRLRAGRPCGACTPMSEPTQRNISAAAVEVLRHDRAEVKD